EPPYLLLRQVGLPGPENGGRSPLVRLDLIECQLRFPALMICGRQFSRGDFAGVHYRGNERDDLIAVAAVGYLVIDRANWRPGIAGCLRVPVADLPVVLAFLSRLGDVREI